MKYGSSTTSSSWTIIIGVWMDLLKSCPNFAAVNWQTLPSHPAKNGFFSKSSLW